MSETRNEWLARVHGVRAALTVEADEIDAEGFRVLRVVAPDAEGVYTDEEGVRGTIEFFRMATPPPGARLLCGSTGGDHRGASGAYFVPVGEEREVRS